MDNYEEKYKAALGWMQSLYGGLHGVTKEDAEKYFPELKESEDEKMRKSIIYALQNGGFYSSDKTDEAIAWLEKQGEQSIESNWCHHKVDLSDCSEEYRKAYYDGWNNCNMQHSQCKSELDDVIQCLIHGMKYYYEDNEDATWGTDKWSMPVKHIIEVLEKQGHMLDADKVIEWLKAKVYDDSTYGMAMIDKFKKDFGL